MMFESYVDILPRSLDGLTLYSSDDENLPKPDLPEPVTHRIIPQFERPMHETKDGVYLAFDSAADFAAHHLAGNEIELNNEKADVEQFNNAGIVWNSWILAPTSHAIPMNGYQREWVLLVEPPKHSNTRFPGLNDIFTVSFLEDFISPVASSITQHDIIAERVDNPFETAGINGPRDLAAFTFLPNFDPILGTDDQVFGPHALAKDMSPEELMRVRIPKKGVLPIRFNLKFNDITFRVERNAITAFMDAEERMKESIRTGPLPRATTRRLGSMPDNRMYFDVDPRQISAFRYILDPRVEPEGRINIFRMLPHMADPLNSTTLPPSLKQRFSELNKDHKKAYIGMNDMACGLHFVSGCPGAGKTHWNVLTSVMAMAGVKADGTRPKILYLIDMNKPVDDVANRIVKLSSEAKIDVKMVRMRGWYKEIDNSNLINSDWRSQSGFENESSSALAKRFLSMAESNQNVRSKRTAAELLAPSLDKACWEYFSANMDKYVDLARALATMLKNGTQTKGESDFLRQLIKGLYSDTLRTIDFVATTPVAASNLEFISMYEPDLIFMDEAPHARELTSLVPIALYRPRAWIFTGDYRQTLPFAADLGRNNDKLPRGQPRIFEENPYMKQMQVSTMERVELLGGRVNTLMINHRAYGNLQRLSSKLFYNKRMSGANKEISPVPASLTHLHNYLCRIGKVDDLKEPRLFVHIGKSCQSSSGLSLFNTAHEEYAMARIEELIADQNFRSIKNPTEKGRILLIAPYRAAVQNYVSRIKSLPYSESHRVDVRTIDTAQGHEADVVILDLVRSSGPGFLNDGHRINVALTRAQQAEIVLMNPNMTAIVRGKRIRRADILTAIWQDAMKKNLITTVS